MTKFVTIALIAIISLLAIAACGDADEESPAPAATPAAPTMAPAPTAAPFTAAPTMAPTAAPATAAPAPTAAPTMAPTPAPERQPQPLQRLQQPHYGPHRDAGHDGTNSRSGHGSPGVSSHYGPHPSCYSASTSAPMAALEGASGGDSDYLYQPVSLSAGEVNDNERWADYLQFRRDYRGPAVHDVDVSERYVITVSDSNGDPIHNANVRVFVGESLTFEGRTYANGQTLFFPLAFDAGKDAETFTLNVEKDGVILSESFSRDSGSEWNVALNMVRPSSGGVPLDILFLLDATGSMADEIDQIKATLVSISSRISDLPSQPDLRFGMVAYRDREDDFVTRLYDFDEGGDQVS